MEFCAIHLGTISQVLMNLIRNVCLETTLLKLLHHFPGANELTLHTTFPGANFPPVPDIPLPEHMSPAVSRMAAHL